MHQATDRCSSAGPIGRLSKHFDMQVLGGKIVAVGRRHRQDNTSSRRNGSRRSPGSDETENDRFSQGLHETLHPPPLASTNRSVMAKTQTWPCSCSLSIPLSLPLLWPPPPSPLRARGGLHRVPLRFRDSAVSASGWLRRSGRWSMHP